MYISACVIVKDEEKNIKKWYESVKNCSDEQIVVDTGSTDATLSILEKLPVKLYSYEWKHDFAAAKNFAIDKAKGDWIIFLDADEYFTVESISEVRNIINKSDINRKIAAILCIKVNINEKDEKEISRFYDLRIFRNTSSLRYKGKIHEQLSYDQIPLQLIKNDNLIIYHTGYSASLAQNKAKRNLEILLSEEQDDKKMTSLHYIAECYYGLGEFDKAITYTEKYWSQKKYRVINGEGCIWRNYINAMILLEKPTDKILAVIFKAIDKFPDLADFYAFAGWTYWQLGSYIAAEKYFKKSLDKFAVYNGIEETFFAADLPKVKKYLEQIALAERNNGKRKVNRPFISACVIVKNNERDILAWLKSVRRHSDELIVVDTGSEDKTIDIVRTAGAFVYNFSWQNDFAAAKNFAVNKAKGEWIIFLDADEYFTDNIDVKKIILELNKQDADAVLCRMINIDKDNGNMEINRFMQLRIFRNDGNIHYEGKVHEQLRNIGRELKLLERKDIIIYHTGYSKTIYLSKLKRNLEILQSDIRKNGEKIHHYRYLADCYYALENYDKSIVYYNKHLGSELRSLGNENDVYFNLIDSMIKSSYSAQEIFAVIKKAHRLFKDYPEFIGQYAAFNFAKGNYTIAKRAFVRALSLHSRNADLPSDNFTAVLPEVYRYLAQIYLYENDRKKAYFYLDKALSINKYNYLALRILCKILKEISFQKTIICLSQYYEDTAKDMVFISEQVFHVGMQELFIYYNKKLFDKFGVYSEKWRLWKVLMNTNSEKSFDDLLTQTVEKVQLLVISLLLSGKLQEKYHSILPESIWQCLSAYYGKNDIHENNFETYKVLLPVIMVHTNDEVIKKYLFLGENFALKQRCEILDELYRLEKWEYMDVFSSFIVNEQLDDNMKHIFKIAKCAYYNGHLNRSEELFRRVLQTGYHADEINSYLTWINDRRVGKW